MNPEHTPLLPMFESAADGLPADAGTLGEFCHGHGAARPAASVSTLRKPFSDRRQNSEVLDAPSVHRFDFHAREVGATLQGRVRVGFHAHWIPLATGAAYFFRISTFCSCKILRRSSCEAEVGDGLEGGSPLP